MPSWCSYRRHNNSEETNSPSFLVPIESSDHNTIGQYLSLRQSYPYDGGYISLRKTAPHPVPDFLQASNRARSMLVNDNTFQPQTVYPIFQSLLRDCNGRLHAHDLDIQPLLLPIDRSS